MRMRYLIILLICRVLLSIVLTSTADAPEQPAARSACEICNCSNQNDGFHVDCSSRNLTKVPKNIPVNTTNLILSYNKISELKVEDFSGIPNLTNLFVKRNILTTLPPQLFANNQNITYINLLDNKLRTIPGTLFHYTPNLVKLRLSHNQLEFVSSDLFAKTSLLENVDLERNNLQNLPPDVFHSTPLIKTISFSHNQLELVSSDLFAKTSLLENVSFQNNSLHDVPPDLFHSTPLLRTVVLGHNRMKELPKGIFKNTTKLENFFVNNNSLEQLRSDLFASAPILKKASFSYNNLHEIPPELFHSTPLIEKINLDNNHLQHVSSDIFAKTPILGIVHLHNNNLQYLPSDLYHSTPLINTTFLSTNRIKQLPTDIFKKATKLRYFFMNNNLLEQLPSDLFANTTILKKVSFSNNNLEDIPPDLFHSTPGIQTMNFSSNNIRSVHASLLSNATVLYSLFLSNNSLTTLPDSLFKFARNLNQLHLSYNKFKSLPEQLFANTSWLSILHLESNSLTTLPPGIFLYTPTLNSINLSSNCLASIPEGLLDNTKDLQSLHVAANKLKSIPSTLFRTTPELYNISFSSNDLESIPAGIFHSTPKLKEIDFVYNRLTELPRDLFAAVEKLKYLQMSANRINVIDTNLFRNVTLTDELDLSNNSILNIPNGLFSSNEKPQLLKTLFLQRNKIRYIQKDAFAGLVQVRIICLFDNQIEAIDSGAFSLKSLQKIFLFKNKLQQITNTSFENSGLSEIHLYGNNITTFTSNVSQGLLSKPTWFLSCELLRYLNASNMIIDCINEKFAPELTVDEVVSTRLKIEGFMCLTENAKKGLFRCKLCKPGTYSLGDNACHPCPRGGYYQDTIGVKSFSSSGCKKCNNGTFVNFAGGASAEDCKVCPEGTYKNMTAGFRACFCKDGYARMDRFGPCYRCNQTGLNCSGLQDYQTVMKGYYWYWHFTGADNEEYRKFVNNLLEESENFDNNSFYSQQIPKVHRCVRPDSCNTNQTGDAPVRGTCSVGYTGWLCNKCKRGYFSLLQKCIKCPSTFVLFVETFFTSVLAVFICYLIWTQYSKHKKRNTDERNLLDIIVSRFKICLGFYQVLGEFFSSIKDVRWIGMFDFMGEVFSYIRLNVLRIFFRPQCFDESLYVNPKIELIISLVIIFSLTVIPFIFYHAVKIYLKYTHGSLIIQSRVKLMKAKIATISLVLLFVTYPPICTAIFQIYHRACVEFCADLKNQSCRMVLRSDFGLQCVDLGVYRVFAYVATATYTIAFPVAVYYLLRKYCAPKMTATPVDSGLANEDSAPLLSIECDEMNIPIGLKFLCENYKPQFWYWEIVELTRKVTQTALLTLLGWEDKLTVLLTIGVSVLFLTLHARYRPMKSVLEQRLQMFSLTAILINVLVAALAMTVPDQYEQRLAIIILLLNISVIAILIIEAVLGAIVQMKRLQFYRRIYDPRRFQQRNDISVNDSENEEGE